ncbi:hypothetical protein BN1708_016495, partial [Verticillium longisporum]
MLITGIDKAKNSICKQRCGYILGHLNIFQPINWVFLKSARAFPVDYILMTLLVLFLFSSSITGIAAVGIRFLWVRIFQIRKGRTAPQALLIATPRFGGGRYYGGGAVAPYRAGNRSPVGFIAPFVLVGAAALYFWPGSWYGHRVQHYEFNNTHTFFNESANENQTKPVICGCIEELPCGCDEPQDRGDRDAFLNELIGNGSYAALNKSVIDAPLLLPLFSLLPDLKAWPIFASLLYIVVDLLSADALAKIADSGEAGASKHFTSPRRATRWNGVAVAAAFLFNPFTIATCLGRSTGVFSTCAILHAIAKAIGGAPVSAVVALTFAGYLSLSPLLLLPPLLLLAYDRQASRRVASPVQFAATHAAVAGATLLALLGLSALLTGGSWAFLGSTYGVQLTLSDLTPNVGLWWYFFVEMFDSFRAFFLAVFWLHLASYVGGLSVRLRAQPLAALTLLLGVLAIFKPYPSLADASLFAAAVPLYRHVFPLMRYPFVTASAILYASFLGPAF